MCIRRIVLVLLVLSCSVGLAQAEWKAATSSSSGDFTLYVDPATIRTDQKNGLAKMWVLSNFKTVQKSSEGAYLSVRGLWHFDCKEERFRISTASYFDGHMANGNLVFNQTEGSWLPVPPGSISKTLSELACESGTP